MLGEDASIKTERHWTASPSHFSSNLSPAQAHDVTSTARARRRVDGMDAIDFGTARRSGVPEDPAPEGTPSLAIVPSMLAVHRLVRTAGGSALPRGAEVYVGAVANEEVQKVGAFAKAVQAATARPSRAPRPSREKRGVRRRAPVQCRG